MCYGSFIVFMVVVRCLVVLVVSECSGVIYNSCSFLVGCSRLLIRGLFIVVSVLLVLVGVWISLLWFLF